MTDQRNNNEFSEDAPTEFEYTEFNPADYEGEEYFISEYGEDAEQLFDESEFGPADYGEDSEGDVDITNDMSEEDWAEVEAAFGVQRINADGHLEEALPTVAIVGRPNVGKSSLLNKLSKSDRAVVDNVAGTTVDPVDELIQLDQKLWRFIDTAGLRKKVKNATGHEYYASLRTRGTIDAAEVCVVLIDASQEITEQDQRVISMVLDAGKAMVIAFNKWDLMDEDRRYYFDREFDMQLNQLPWVSKINISAETGRGLHRLEQEMITALENWDRRISTGQLNNWLREAIAANPPPMKNNRLPKVLFATMAGTRPPTIVLFTTGFLDAGYRRYLERKFREQFGYHGTPVRFAVRVRERNPKRR